MKLNEHLFYDDKKAASIEARRYIATTIGVNAYFFSHIVSTNISCIIFILLLVVFSTMKIIHIFRT